MLDKIRTLFSKRQTLKFVATDVGWFVERLGAIDAEDAFDWAAEQSDEERGLAYFLAQLISEELAVIDESGLTILWNNIYSISNNSDYSSLLSVLQLPELTTDVRPILDSQGTLSDTDFSLNISGWRINNDLLKNANRVGAYISWEGKSYLMSQSSWELVNKVYSFNAREADQKTSCENELAWGSIRSVATKANCFYNSRYLEGTVIITPESLELKLDRLEESGESITTVSPTFVGAPDDWLSRFDLHSKAQGSYTFSSEEGVRKVILSEPVKQVLNVIKRDMPQRKVVGRTAEAFLRNPYALLGEDAFKVIDECAFERQREKIGVSEFSWKFNAVLSGSLIEHVNVDIETESGVVIEIIHNCSDFGDFLQQLKASIASDRVSHDWRSYHLSLDGRASSELAQGERILAIWLATENHVIDTQQIYDLSGYSDRVIGIGELRPVGLPILIKAEEGDSWSPELRV